MATVNPTKHLTNLNEWRRLGEAAIFPPESRLELINGEILEMAPIGSNHAGHLKRINKLFTRFVPDNVIISVQDPLQLGDLSEPEPDFMLLKPSDDFYSSRHPDCYWLRLPIVRLVSTKIRSCIYMRCTAFPNTGCLTSMIHAWKCIANPAARSMPKKPRYMQAIPSPCHN